MKLSRATIALYVGLVFVSGAVLGFFGNRLYTASTVSASKSGSTKAPPLPKNCVSGSIRTTRNGFS